MQYSDFCDSDLLSEGDYTSHLPKNIDQYQGHGMALIEKSAIMSLDYAKALLANKQEKYAKIFQKFNNLYYNQKIKHVKVSTIFVNPIRPKDVMLKKGKHCGLSLRKALKEEEVEKQQ